VLTSLTALNTAVTGLDRDDAIFVGPRMELQSGLKASAGCEQG
jgi:hypothetical protein